MTHYMAIRPGQVWLDTNGNRIQAHGGSIFYQDGTYYWYGENKDQTFVDSGYWYNGVNCYSSNDLYNWKYEGKILKPSEDPASPLHHSKMCDRPHILYNARTKKYVMWIKVMGDAGIDSEEAAGSTRQFMCIAVSDTITGEYKYVKRVYPLGMFSGDFDLYAEPSDGKAYIIFERVRTELIIADLTEDYMDVNGHYTAHFPCTGVIMTREAPCLFRREQDFYLITSGISGYFPNPSELAHAELIHGPWEVLGDPCIDDTNRDSFNAQFGCVFKVQGKKNLYMAMGDRWMDGTSAEEGMAAKYNTALANYVWLPIIWEDGKPRIAWREEWTLDEFEDGEDDCGQNELMKSSFGAAIMAAYRRQGGSLPAEIKGRGDSL